MTARLHEIDNLRSEFERRLEEKDNMIRNLQDRIQSYLYDRNGEPWTKVQRPQVSQQADQNSHVHETGKQTQSLRPEIKQTQQKTLKKSAVNFVDETGKQTQSLRPEIIQTQQKTLKKSAVNIVDETGKQTQSLRPEIK
jgi:hypothetical protein